MQSSAQVITALNTDTKDAKTDIKAEEKKEHKLIKKTGDSFDFVMRDDFSPKIVESLNGKRSYWQPFKLHIIVDVDSVSKEKKADLESILDPAILNGILQEYKLLNPTAMSGFFRMPYRVWQCYVTIYLINEYDENNLSQVVSLIKAIEAWSKGAKRGDIYGLSSCDLPLTEHVYFRLAGLGSVKKYYVGTTEIGLDTLIELTEKGLKSLHYTYLAKAFGVTIADDEIIQTVKQRCASIGKQLREKYQMSYGNHAEIIYLMTYLMAHPDLLKLSDDELMKSLNIAAISGRDCSEFFDKSSCNMSFNPSSFYEKNETKSESAKNNESDCECRIL